MKNPDRSASCSRSRIVLLVLATLVAACTGTGSPSPATSQRSVTSLGPNATDGPRAVVIDTDMAADDWLAILYLLGRPEVNVKAITVTGAGEAHCGPGVRNALGLVALAGQPDIPVACGREKPLAGDHAFPAPWRDGVDTLLGLSLAENPNRPASDSAVQLLAATLRSSPDRVTLLTLGPLTNPAELLRDSPELADRIGAVYVMGGAVDVEGNVGVSGVGIENRFAEWNVYVDPVAANLLLSSGVPVTLVPLDATNHAPVTTAFAERLAGAPQSASGVELSVIAAVILGGTSLSGGRGTVWGTLLGVVIMGTLNNGLALMRVSSFYQEVARGAVLLLAVAVDQLGQRRRR